MIESRWKRKKDLSTRVEFQITMLHDFCVGGWKNRQWVEK
jgi:hypothetical protein